MTGIAARRNRVYLTGFMGSGKSTIGPILANAIGYDFVDVDRAIEKRAGKTVREIFRESGESSFRAVEREVIGQISQTPRLVVALGGGTLTDPETFKSITASGILVYLRVSPDQLFRRVQAKSDRPLLMDLEGNRLNEGELRQRIIHLYEQREPMYNKADLVFEADEAGVGLAVDKIVRKISAYIE